MPLVSRAQAGYLAAHDPNVFREFAAKTPDIGSLPERVTAPKTAKPKSTTRAVRSRAPRST